MIEKERVGESTKTAEMQALQESDVKLKEKTQKVKELQENIKDMNNQSTKDTAKRKNKDKQAEAKLQALEQENTKLQEGISKLTKDKAARD
mmetsp:Transcript_32824/g.52847  ORF Transcript_32824/g.52847 Transcript_32824/m.52847 type:complete len:91 (-) Transcript_32824:846-1118(-)